jgi:hypothetical protein
MSKSSKVCPNHLVKKPAAQFFRYFVENWTDARVAFKICLIEDWVEIDEPPGKEDCEIW